MTRASRRALSAIAGVLLAGVAVAQEAPKLVLPRPSPSATVKQTVGVTDITIAYSSPAVRGRKIWGEVVPWDEVWRAGANECTKATFSTAVTIGGKAVEAGTYCLVLLPTRSGWTFILNKDTKLWGAYGYKAESDILRVPATTMTIPARERLAFEVLDFGDGGGTLALEWDTLRVSVKFELATREFVLASIKALKTDEWRPYANAARYLLDTGTEPALALQLADKSISLQEDWYNTWIKAQLLAAAGKKREAVEVARRSQELGKKASSFPLADDIARAIADWSK
jgi:hypothetical protein